MPDFEELGMVGKAAVEEFAPLVEGIHFPSIPTLSKWDKIRSFFGCGVSARTTENQVLKGEYEWRPMQGAGFNGGASLRRTAEEQDRYVGQVYQRGSFGSLNPFTWADERLRPWASWNEITGKANHVTRTGAYRYVEDAGRQDPRFFGIDRTQI
jgi:hypothetical protein